jgi:hypothetical protein
VIDIGGGSVELTLGDAASLRLARSVKLGVIRLTQAYVKSDPLGGRDERRLTKHIRQGIDGICKQIVAAGFDRVIGTSGNDPQPRHHGRGGRTWRGADRAPQPAGARQAPSPPAPPCRRDGRQGTLDAPGARPAPRGPHGGRRRAARHHPAAAGRRRPDAVRSGAARGAGARLHPPAPERDRPHRADPRRAPPQRAGAGRALQLLRGSRAENRAAVAGLCSIRPARCTA